MTAVGIAAFVAATALGTARRALGYAALGDFSSAESIAAVGGLAAFGALGLWLAARDPELRAVIRAWWGR